MFCLFVFLAGLAVFLAHRLYKVYYQPFMQTYTLHLAFWNGHALVMIMLYLLGTEVLPPDYHFPMGLAVGPLVILLLALSLYFLVLFMVQMAERALPRNFPVFYLLPWGLLLITYVFMVGKKTLSEAEAFPPIHTLLFSILKIGTILFFVIFLLYQAQKTDDQLKRRYFPLIAWIYLTGFLLFQLSVIRLIPAYSLPYPDYFIAFFQLGYHFPVLAVLSRYLNHQIVTRPPISPLSDLEKQMSEIGISQREAEIIGLILRGFSNNEIGNSLFISQETVKKHISNIYKKLGVKNRLQLSYFIQNRMGPIKD